MGVRRGGEYSQRAAALSSCNHVEPLGARVQSHPGVQPPGTEARNRKEHRTALPCCGTVHSNDWRSRGVEGVQPGGHFTISTLRETHISLHRAKHLGITGTQSVGTAEVPPCLLRLSRHPWRNRATAGLPTIPQEVTASRERRTTLQRCRAGGSSSSSSKSCTCTRSKMNQHRSHAAYWVNFQKQLQGDVSLWGISPAGESSGVHHELACRVKIKKENQYPREKNTYSTLCLQPPVLSKTRWL